MQDTDFSSRSSVHEKKNRYELLEKFENSPISKKDLVYSQLGLYLPRQELSRILALSELYKNHVLSANGIMVEFGTCYGRTASILTNLRGIFEPFNFTRRLVIFDTFSGLRGVQDVDGSNTLAREGAYSTGDNYENYLEAILNYHESEAPISHIKKFEIVKGDASVTATTYFNAHKEAIVALVYFDFDIYGPTKSCLETIRPHLTKSSVLVFDQLNCPEYPGETVAFSEIIGLNNCHVRRSPLTPWLSYVLCEDFMG